VHLAGVSVMSAGLRPMLTFLGSRGRCMGADHPKKRHGPLGALRTAFRAGGLQGRPDAYRACSNVNTVFDVPSWILVRAIARIFWTTGSVLRWSRLSEQIFRVDKWTLCRG
jgi:hypothetical protein